MLHHQVGEEQAEVAALGHPILKLTKAGLDADAAVLEVIMEPGEQPFSNPCEHGEEDCNCWAAVDLH